MWEKVPSNSTKWVLNSPRRGVWGVQKKWRWLSLFYAMERQKSSQSIGLINQFWTIGALKKRRFFGESLKIVLSRVTIDSFGGWLFSWEESFLIINGWNFSWLAGWWQKKNRWHWLIRKWERDLWPKTNRSEWRRAEIEIGELFASEFLKLAGNII